MEIDLRTLTFDFDVCQLKLGADVYIFTVNVEVNVRLWHMQVEVRC